MLVSIYIPTKNRITLLERAINSVLEQDYKNIELIVVDDCSSDGTQSLLAELDRQGKLKAIYQKASVGACKARNEAIQASTGICVTGLDDDDFYSDRTKISKFVAAWQGANRSLAGLFDCATIQAGGEVQQYFMRSYVEYADLRKSNYVGNQVFAPREYYLGAGLFDPKMPAWQDWDLWLRMAHRYGGFSNIQLCGTRINADHAQGRISEKSQDVLREAMRTLMHKLEPMGKREKSYLITALYAYPQVKPTISEIATIVAGRRVSATLESMFKLLKRY